MTSMQKKEMISKTEFLITGNSFEKIKCTLNQLLLGSLLTKSFKFINILENSLISSRILVQKMVRIIVFPVINIILVAMELCWRLLLAKANRGVSNEKFAQDKKSHADEEIKKSSESKIDDENIMSSEFGSHHNNLLQSHTILANDNSGTFCDRLNLTDTLEKCCKALKLIVKTQQNLFLLATVYTAISILIFEGIILIYVVCNANFKLGSQFLIFCVLYIGVLALKISFTQKTRIENSHNGRLQQRPEIINNSRTIRKSKSKPTAFIMPHVRQSRSISREIKLKKL